MPNICNFENCRNRAYFGYTNGCFERCKEHKEDRPRALAICMCGSSKPFFDEPGVSKAKFCSKCKTPTMINLQKPRKKCKCGSDVIPCFNEPGEAKGICCKVCKTPTMVDVMHKKCKCGKVPSFNVPGEKFPICCKACKTPTMVNIKTKKCRCGKATAHYNEPNEKIPVCCASCKTDTMIDIVNKKCKCGKSIPYYNEPGEKFPICCASCKTPTMVDVKNPHCKCGKYAIYNEPGEKSAICCASCKTDTMEDKTHKRCKSENCPVVANRNYKGYCANCFKHLFPNDPLSLQAKCKTKELAVRDYINSNFEGFICDRRLKTAHCDCTIRRRPDLRILKNETLLVIEIDENQHKSYSEMDEETRYNDLYMAYSGKWIYIRFNPDKFKKNNKNVNPTLSRRLPVLKDEIEKQFRRIENNENKELIERIYLYFDK